jgi:hypothetical protein
VDVNAVLRLDERASRTSNDAGDTLSAAVTRIGNLLTSQGFQQTF